MPLTAFRKILIANRGEIALRIARACRELGIVPVAVYSDADAAAPHVRAAAEAVRIGPAPARESYLDVDAVIRAATRSGCQALHPGYGFLSERPELAEACARAGITFIGPPAEVIRLLGDKVASKKLMRQSNVPVVPGSAGGSEDLDALEREGRSIPFPLLVKAAAGGGGKGMRVVREPAALRESLEGASREAKAAFGDGRVFLERYVENPRHVEVQVLADAHGHVVALGERECSIQRRHQKVLEESPSPALTPGSRAALLDAAVRAARAASYVNAGTVEFLLAPDGEFYFLEVNTRLQVEHPVTEMVTGLDLVRLQIAVAVGEPLPFVQADVSPRGHAIEVRLYAEDPASGFLPTSGRIARLALPEGPGVRNDAGVAAGDEIGIHYDPMLAKLIVWAEDRPAALARLARALDETAIDGLATNLDFLRWLCRQPDVVAGTATTKFLESNRYAPAPAAEPPLAWLDAAALLLSGAFGDAPAAWRSGGQDMPARFLAGGAEHRHLVSRLGGDRWNVRRDGGPAHGTDRSVTLLADGAARLAFGADSFEARACADGPGWILSAAGHTGRILPAPPIEAAAGHRHHHGPVSLTAPMPGSIIRLEVKEGEDVAEGQKLLVLEAMKMEHTLTAPEPGRVKRLPYKAGDVVPLGAILVEMEEK